MRETHIVVPVQILNKDLVAKSDLVPIEEDNLTVTLTIRGSASDTYSIKPSDFKLVSDLNSYAVKKVRIKYLLRLKVVHLMLE